MSGKCREADDFQICVDLWAVINDFEGLPIECCTLIRTKPFGIHIAEQAAERVIQQLFQWLLFQFCQCRVSIAEDPVYSMMLLIEDHLDIGERERKFLKAAVMAAVFFFGIRRFLFREFPDNIPLLFLKLFDDLFLFSEGVDQSLPVAEVDLIRDTMDRSRCHDTAPVDLQKCLSQLLLQLRKTHPRFIDLLIRQVNFCISADHQNIQDSIPIQHDLFAARYHRNIFFLHDFHLLRVRRHPVFPLYPFLRQKERAVPGSVCRQVQIRLADHSYAMDPSRSAAGRIILHPHRAWWKKQVQPDAVNRKIKAEDTLPRWKGRLLLF